MKKDTNYHNPSQLKREDMENRNFQIETQTQHNIQGYYYYQDSNNYVDPSPMFSSRTHNQSKINTLITPHQILQQHFLLTNTPRDTLFQFQEFKSERQQLQIFWPTKNNNDYELDHQYNLFHDNSNSSQNQNQFEQKSEKFVTPIKKFNKKFISFTEPKQFESHNNNQLVSEVKKEKGLKMLAIKVKNIVNEFEITTYKDVAEHLIKTEYSHLQKQCKEEFNIKRRVYDALNVLIASKIIDKVNKSVRKNENTKKIGKKFKNSFMNSLQEQEQLIKIKQQNLDNKKKLFFEQNNKLQKISELLKRNTRNQKKNLQFKEQQVNDKLQPFIYFPFIFIDNNLNQIEIEKNEESTAIQIKSQQNLDIKADLDFLENIKLEEEQVKYQVQNGGMFYEINPMK